MEILIKPSYGCVILEIPEENKTSITDINGNAVTSEIKFDGFKVLAVGEPSSFNVGDMVLHNVERIPVFNCKFRNKSGNIVHKKVYLINESEIWGKYEAGTI